MKKEMMQEDDIVMSESEPDMAPASGSGEYVPGIWDRCHAYCADAKNIWRGAGILLFVALLWKGLGAFGAVPIGDFPIVSPARWQAVFLSNGQVYFGHLQNYNRGYTRLQDIYYLQAQQPLQSGEPVPPALNLVKFGRELHGPEDAMMIPKNQILFWENMKDDSQVVKAILSTRK